MNWGASRRRKTFWQHVGSLLGHLSATAVIFVTVFTLGWAISFIVHYLDSIHPFSPRSRDLIEHIEVSLLWIDTGISGLVLLVGASRFVHDVWIDLS